MNENLRAAIRTLREGDGLPVTTLRELGKTVVEVLAVIEQVHAKGAYVVDASGRRSDKDAVAMISDGLPYLRKGKTKREAVAHGKKGGRPRMERRLSHERAEAIWHDARIKTDKIAAARIGVSLSTARRDHGPSGRKKAGRPKKT